MASYIADAVPGKYPEADGKLQKSTGKVHPMCQLIYEYKSSIAESLSPDVEAEPNRCTP